MKSLLERVWDYSLNNPLGFTIDLEMNEITDGYAVAFEETQNCFGVEGLQRVLDFAITHQTAIGGWLDKTTGKYYFDATMVVEDKGEALRIAKQNNQLAICCLRNGKEIRL